MLGKIACFDNGGSTYDRYAVVLLDYYPYGDTYNYRYCIGLSDNCEHTTKNLHTPVRSCRLLDQLPWMDVLLRTT